MKMLLLIATLAIAAPAFAATSEPSAPTPAAQDAKKADPGKPFIYDANRRPIPSKPAPKKTTGPAIG